MGPSSAGELPPLERAGSPTSAEKDILVCYLYPMKVIQRDFAYDVLYEN